MTRLAGALSLALAVFLLVAGGGLFAGSFADHLRVYGWRNATDDFDLTRWSGYGLLAFAAQAAFGLYFGAWAARYERERALSGWAPGAVSANPAILCLLAWLVLFNAPLLAEVWRVLQEPGLWARMHAHGVPLWPPRRLYAPLQNDLQVFLPLGNLGLFAGFLGAFGLANASARPAPTGGAAAPNA